MRRAVARSILLGMFVGLFSAPLTAAHAATWQVDMLDHNYRPAELNITVGDTVTWRNIESHDDKHTVTSTIPGRNEEDPTPTLDSGIIEPGESFTFTFSEPGDFPYYCRTHGFDMTGIVMVRAPGVPFAEDDELDATKQSDTEPATGTVDVLENDFNREEGETLRVTSYDTATTGGGTVACTESGDCTYTSPTAACGSKDSFNYTISDGTHSDSATVWVRVLCGATNEASDTQVSLKLRKHLKATGGMVTEALACKRGRKIKVQRSTASGWKTVGSGRSGRDGSFSISVADRPGTYRVKVPASMLTSGQKCKGDVSPTHRHAH